MSIKCINALRCLVQGQAKRQNLTLLLFKNWNWRINGFLFCFRLAAFMPFHPSSYPVVLGNISILTEKQFEHCPSKLSEPITSSCAANLTVDSHEIISKRQKSALKWFCVSVEGQLFFFSSVASLGHSLYNRVCVCVFVFVCVCACACMRASSVRRSLGWKDPPEEGMGTHSSTPGDFQGQRSLMGYSP